jgi:hypothetical protein
VAASARETEGAAVVGGSTEETVASPCRRVAAADVAGIDRSGPVGGGASRARGDFPCNGARHERGTRRERGERERDIFKKRRVRERGCRVGPGIDPITWAYRARQFDRSSFLISYFYFSILLFYFTLL